MLPKIPKNTKNTPQVVDMYFSFGRLCNMSDLVLPERIDEISQVCWNPVLSQVTSLIEYKNLAP